MTPIHLTCMSLGMWAKPEYLEILKSWKMYWTKKHALTILNLLQNVFKFVSFIIVSYIYIVLWSGSARIVQLIGNSAMGGSCGRWGMQCAHLATEAEQWGWRVYPVEVGCRGFVAHSTTQFLRDVGFNGQSCVAQ